MELCFYNAVMTGMSSDGKQFTYVNQLASSDSDLSKRAEWFTCACCPPNITRLLGYIGGYLWTSKVEKQSLEIHIHMYSSAALSTKVGNEAVELEQESNWPWEGKVRFTLRNPSRVQTTIRLRIPGWADSWQVCFPKLCQASLTLKDFGIAPRYQTRERVLDFDSRLVGGKPQV